MDRGQMKLTSENLLDVPRANYDATCHTSGCHNEGITFTVPADVHEQRIICGPCGIRITDIKEA
jgi:hypothetical protein